MKIRKFEVAGLLGREGTIATSFYPDLNIITGRNGAGKTTFIKLIWYILSGNISQAVSEIDFDWAQLETDEYTCKIFKINSLTCRAEISEENSDKVIIEDVSADEDHSFLERDARDVLSDLLTPIGSSLFFPTFRRIEGGFSMPGNKGRTRLSSQSSSRDLEEAMAALARRVSKKDHTFVSSISTIDIEGLLLKNYTELSEQYNRLQQSVSAEIIETIRGYKNDTSDSDGQESTAIKSANEVIEKVRVRIESMETDRKLIMAPMDAVQKVTASLFTHAGIRFGTRLSFGDAASAVNSEALSAGEKQILSFICYNAFKKNCPIFIDEPELSLHIDWQRSLFPTLLGQNSSNQFVIATHSPFIYAKYPDKEICIDADSDRGDNTEIVGNDNV